MALPLILAMVLAAAQPAQPDPALVPSGPEGDVPAGAPTDDYGLVAWCRGALSGHMELYPVIKPQLDGLSKKEDAAKEAEADAAQMAAGREYLSLYKRALDAAEQAASNSTLRQRGSTAEAQGYRIWAGVRASDPQNRMWGWLNWSLPGRCETAAKRLEQRSDLFGVALRSDGAAARPATPEPAATPAPAVPAAPETPAAAEGLRGQQ